VAADKGHFELMDILLKHGAKVNWHIQLAFVAYFCLWLFSFAFFLDH